MHKKWKGNKNVSVKEGSSGGNEGWKKVKVLQKNNKMAKVIAFLLIIMLSVNWLTLQWFAKWFLCIDLDESMCIYVI